MHTVGMKCDQMGIEMDSLTTTPGYFYNPNEQSNSANNIYSLKCTPEKSCLNNTQCDTALGYRENSFLCFECKENYYRTGSLQSSSSECLPCFQNPNSTSSTLSLYIFMYVLLTFSASLFVLYSAGKKISGTNKKKDGKIKTSTDNYPTTEAELTASKDIQLSVVAQRSAISHLQVLGLIGRLDFQWPDVLTSFFSFSDTAGSTSVSSVNGLGILDASTKCLLYQPQIPYPHNELITNVISYLLTGVLAVLMTVALNYISCRQKTKVKEQGISTSLLSKVLLSIIVLSFSMYSKLVRSLMQLFSCSSLNGQFPTSRLQGAYHIKCSSSDPTYFFYTTLLTIPVLLVFVLGFPIFALLRVTYLKRDIINRNGTQLDDERLRLYSFLFVGYKEDKWFWEWYDTYVYIYIYMYIQYISYNYICYVYDAPPSG